MRKEEEEKENKEKKRKEKKVNKEPVTLLASQMAVVPECWTVILLNVSDAALL